MKKMEREYERRQQEILLEAEAAVRAREEALNQVSEIISLICEILHFRNLEGCERSLSGRRLLIRFV